MKNYNIAPIKTLLDSAKYSHNKTALIAVPQISIDAMSSALALALLLQKLGLKTQVYCPQKPDANYSKLVGLEMVTEVCNPNDLVISLDYPVDQIENVSYNNENERLNLIVKTKDNAPKIENKNIIINNQSSLADICFLFGDENNLGNLASIVHRGSWIHVSPTNVQKPWARASVLDQDAPYSEICSFLLPMIGLHLDVNAAKNLLIGLRVATQSFSLNVSPETFEAGANCLRSTQPEPEPEPTNHTPNQFDNFTPVESVESKPNNTLKQQNNPSSVPTV